MSLGRPGVLRGGWLDGWLSLLSSRSLIFTLPCDIRCESSRGVFSLGGSTNTSVPLFDGGRLKKGAHVNAVGSYTPTMHELDAATMRRAVVVIDTGKRRPAVCG